MTVYGRFAGGRLAIVGSMPHAAFREGVHAAREFGCEIWLLVQAGDRHTGGRPLPRADRVLHVDTHDWRAIVDAVTDSEGRPAVHGVTSFRVDLTEATARAAEHLGLPSQGLEAVRTANRRHLLRRALGDDPANVKWRLVSSAEELDEAIRYVGLPLVVRPPSGAAPHGARTCGTGAEAVAAWRELSGVRWSLPGRPHPGPVLVEEWVRGTGIGVESLTVAGETHFSGATSKHRRGGASPEEALSFPLGLRTGLWEEVKRCVDRALRRIGHRQGPAHTEVAITGDGPKITGIVPCLPTPAISAMIADVCGTDPYLDAGLLALGLVPEPGMPGDGRCPASAAVALFPDAPGRLVGIGGLLEARAHGAEVHLHAEPGDTVAAHPDGFAPVGFVRAHADTADRALRKARYAASLIHIDTWGERPRAAEGALARTAPPGTRRPPRP
ncbi:ATP-grasp domain-containing protein [Streptomyces megasporus]|uniref:ATP-grasp domain-containing protein n=1 Tax=Streptomyces megasporus TaxID=44060 RepID=UPI000690A04A|nr:hypothetical protein [Streptomyces megasporus]